MAPPTQPGRRTLSSNRKARHEFLVLDRLECGIELRGTEVKSVKAGNVTLTGGFARLENGEVILCNVNIQPYEHGNRFNHEPDRDRRLLLHRGEIRRLEVQAEQKGHALVPLSVYLSRGRVKVELGVCKGKRRVDKRETLRRRTAQRDAERDMRSRR